MGRGDVPYHYPSGCPHRYHVRTPFLWFGNWLGIEPLSHWTTSLRTQRCAQVVISSVGSRVAEQNEKRHEHQARTLARAHFTRQR